MGAYPSMAMVGPMPGCLSSRIVPVLEPVPDGS